VPTHSREHSDTTQITKKILKQAAKPRQSASVSDAFEKKKNRALVGPETLGGNKGGKTRAAKARVSR
jgi:hypothetical protein